MANASIGLIELQNDSDSSFIGEEYVISPLRLGWFGIAIFIVSSLFLIITLVFLIRHRKDDKFLYRSPNLVIATFMAAL